jgi:hypothetical protein
MKVEERKEWIAPVLIILLRSNSQEVVLDSCKGDTLSTRGPYSTHSFCFEGCDSTVKMCDVVGKS